MSHSSCSCQQGITGFALHDLHTRYTPGTAEALGRTHLAVPRYQLSPNATHLTQQFPVQTWPEAVVPTVQSLTLTLSFNFHV